MKGRKRSYMANWLPYSKALYEYEQDLITLWESYTSAVNPLRKKILYKLWYHVLCQKHYLQKSFNLAKNAPFNHPLTYAHGKLRDE